MLARVAVLCCCLSLVASCDKASALLGAGNQQTPPAIQQPAPQQDTRKAIYELQEKCAHDARDWHKQWYLDSPTDPSIFVTSDYTNHYNARLGRCFIAVEMATLSEEKKTGRAITTHNSRLVDVLENRDLGSAVWFSGDRPFQCQIDGVECHSRDQWAGLLKPYMEN
jgi:hypothetical protein